MGERVHDARVESRPSDLAGLLPLVSPVVGRAGDARWVAEAGRAATVWLPVFVLCTDVYSSAAVALVVGSAAGAVWFLALRSAFGTVPFTLGPAIPAAVGTLVGLVVVSAFHLWLPALELPSRTLLLMAVSVFVLTTAWEAVWRRLIVAKRRVLVVGTTSGAAEIVGAMNGSRQTPFRVVGVVGEVNGNGNGNGHGTALAHAPLLGTVDDLARIVEAQRPDLIVLTEGDRSGRVLNSLLDVASSGFKVVGVANFFEHAFGWVPLRSLTPAWFMGILHLHQRTYSRFAKRTFDLLCASIGLVVVAPILPIIALLVRRSSPGPIIYRQTRVGEAGKLFTMYKFRTMEDGAEQPGKPVFAEEDDPRVTKFGRALRQTHLDELPQLWNVLRGDMSMVGPRPERPEFVTLLEQTIPFLARRLLVKPGITGWAQLRCDYASDSETAADRLSYDLWYLRHRNLTVDLAICAKTFSALVLHSGR
jgi:exopolysaccharide biosynthesis polyprenyl glycosylphosphotransferase